MHELNIYCAAMKLPSGERDMYIQTACHNDPQLLGKVRSLFDAKRLTPSQSPQAPASMPGKALKTRIVNGVLIAYFADARILDSARINEIGPELLALIQRCPDRRMILSFNAVQFMSSALLGKIISLNRECGNAQIELRICDITPSIMKVFKLMKLTGTLNICKTEEEAIASFEKRSFLEAPKRTATRSVNTPLNM